MIRSSAVAQLIGRVADRTGEGLLPQHHLRGQWEDDEKRALHGGFQRTGTSTGTGTTGTGTGTGTTGTGTGNWAKGPALGGLTQHGGYWTTGSLLWTGLRQSMDTVSVREPISKVKNLSAWARTFYRPWYSWERGWLETSSWKETKSVEAKAAETQDAW